MSMFCRKTYRKIKTNYHRTLKVIYQSEESYENSYWKVVQFLYIKDIYVFY